MPKKEASSLLINNGFMHYLETLRIAQTINFPGKRYF